MNKIMKKPYGINYILLQMHCIFLQFESAICSWIVPISESHATNEIHGSSQKYPKKKKKHNLWLYAYMLIMQPFQEIYAQPTESKFKPCATNWFLYGKIINC